MTNTQTISREEYRRLDEVAARLLEQRSSAGEIIEWVESLHGKRRSIACAILRRRCRDRCGS